MATSFIILLLLGGLLYRAFGGRSKPSAKQVQALVNEAESSHIISAQQRQDLLALYQRQQSASMLSGSTWIAIFAGLSVIAGFSLIIAHNWDQITAPIRIAGYLLLLACVAEGYARTLDRSKAVHLPFEFLWFFFPLLGIGLYAQTFQLSGDPVRPYVVWLALATPIVWMSRHRYIGVFYLIALATLLLAGNHTAGILNLAAKPAGWDSADPVAWLMTSLIWIAAWVANRHYLPQGHGNYLIGLGAIWLLALLFDATPFHLEHAGWLFVAALSLAILWTLAPTFFLESLGHENFSGLVMWLGTIYSMTFLWHGTHSLKGSTTTSGLALASLCLVAAAAVTLFAPLHKWVSDRRWIMAIRATLLASLALVLLMLADSAALQPIIALLANAFLILAAGLLIGYGAHFGGQTHVNLGVAVLFLLLVTRFIDILGDMLQSGVGFIVAGLFFGLLAWMLEKVRKRVIGSRQEAAP
jgi:Predicted membrane protein (DUF2157)